MTRWPTDEMVKTALESDHEFAYEQGNRGAEDRMRNALTAALDAAPEVDGSAWCEYEGAIHDNEPDPYTYGEGYVCPGPHRALIVGTEAR